MKRKIAESVNVLIRTGDFQHIGVTKYAEELIEYENEEERQQKEDKLSSDLLDSLMRSMHETGSKFNREKFVYAYEEKAAKAIPAWLTDQVAPNIANDAKAEFDKAQSKAHDKSTAREREFEALSKGGSTPVEKAQKPEPPPPKKEEDPDEIFDEDLFKDD